MSAQQVLHGLWQRRGAYNKSVKRFERRAQFQLFTRTHILYDNRGGVWFWNSAINMLEQID